MDDLISKASVCEILADIYPTDGEKVVAVKEIDKAYDTILNLPSAQPEPIKINIDDFNKEDLERFKKELRNTPITVLPAQPEIIRCKDCRYYQDNNDGYPHINCKWDANETPDADDFCSGAERRTDE